MTANAITSDDFNQAFTAARMSGDYKAFQGPRAVKFMKRYPGDSAFHSISRADAKMAYVSRVGWDRADDTFRR